MNFSWVIPGKLAGSQGPLIREELMYLKGHGIRALVRLERRTTSGEELGLSDLAEFVPDMQAPTDEQIDRIIGYIDHHIEDGSEVGVSCRAGYGRTGTVLACYLVHTGYSAGDALRQVRKLRPGSVEAPEQQEFVHGYERRLRSIQG